jgi:ubiquinone/menaquinone biosynthesis C-methylase UbiE
LTIYYCKMSKSPMLFSQDELRSDERSVQVTRVGAHRVPIFVMQQPNHNEFTVENAVELHNNAMNWLMETHGTTDEDLRRKLMSAIPSKLDRRKPSRILVTGCGEGRDLPYLFAEFPNSSFYVQDIAFPMLRWAIESNVGLLKGRDVEFWCGDATDLPFEENSFDVVYHFGGLNLFPSIKLGVEEMYRVLKVGGACLFGDEGIAPYMYNSEISNALIKNNPLYKHDAPVRYIPPYLSEFKLEYLLNNCFYLVTFIKEPNCKINIDVPHLGRRGGTIRSRYYGELEGVDPTLRNRLYAKASAMNVSRVELLEKLIREGTRDDA